MFPIITNESVLQINDKFRINCCQSFVVDDTHAITDFEISPDDGNTWFSVFNDGDKEQWFLDWAYSLEGIKVIN